MTDTLTDSVSIHELPRKTLEYFVTIYTSIGYDSVMDLDTAQLIKKLSDAGYISRVERVYLETITSVNREKNRYNFYIRHIGSNSTDRASITYDRIIRYLDESHLFGKAIFMLLVNLGNMEMGNDILIAERKRAEEIAS